MEKFTHQVGKLAVFTGALSALLTISLLIMHLHMLMLLSILFGLLGFICSNIYIFLNMRYQVNEKKFTPGTLGILLSSAPILLMVVSKILYKA